MKALLALCLLATLSNARAAEEKAPKWSLVVSHNGVEADKKTTSVPTTRQIIDMGANSWTCATVPDPAGDDFKMGVVCQFEKQTVSMPVICHEKMAKIASLTVGNEKFFTAIALICEPHKGRTTPLPAAKK